jgi:hypothetical protein
MATEGAVDEAVLRRLVSFSGLIPGRSYGRKGKDWLRSFAPAFAEAAPWDGLRFLLVDLDEEAACGLALRDKWFTHGHSPMFMPVAVKEVDAWLLADRTGFAEFFRVRPKNIPVNPDGLAEPKDKLVGICAASSARRIASGMVPRENSGRRVGMEYSRLVEQFVATIWDPAAARAASPSLDYCLRKLEGCGAL